MVILILVTSVQKYINTKRHDIKTVRMTY